MLDRPGEGVVVRAVVAEVLHLGRCSGHDRHHVARAERRRARGRVRRNRHIVALVAVGHRVLVLRMGVAVVGPSAGLGDHLQLLRGSRDSQRARNTCDVVVRRHIRAVRRDHHVVLGRDRARVLANLSARGAEGHVVRVAAHKALTLGRLGHLYRVDRDSAARVLVRLALARERHRSLSDLEGRRRRRNSLVVRVSTLHVDCVLASVHLLKARQVAHVCAVLLEAVSVRRRSSGCRARRGVRVVVSRRVVHVLVVGQSNLELVVRGIDRQLAVHHRDGVVGCHVVVARHDHNSILRRDRARVLASLSAASGEGHVVRVAAHKALTLGSRGHLYRVDRDSAARVLVRLTLARERHRSLSDLEGRRRRRNSLVVRVSTLHVDCVLASVHLLKARQVAHVCAVLLEAVSVRRRSSGCRARRGVRVVVSRRVVHVLVVGQSNLELVVRGIDRQLAVHHRDGVVGCHVVVARHDHNSILRRDRARVLASLSAASGEGHVVRVAAHKTHTLGSRGHLYRVDRNSAARVLVRLALARERHRTLADLLRQIVNHSVVVNTFRSGKTARSTSQGCASCIGISTDIRTVRSDHTGRNSIPVHQTSHLIIRIGGGIGARERRAVVNLLGIQGDGQRCRIDNQLTVIQNLIIVARHIRRAAHHRDTAQNISLRACIRDAARNRGRDLVVVRQLDGSTGSGCAADDRLTQLHRVGGVAMLRAVIRPLAIVSRHRQGFGDRRDRELLGNTALGTTKDCNT